MTSPAREAQWQEGARGLLLLAAANETGLLSQVEEVLPKQPQRSSVLKPLCSPQRSLLLTLLFLPAVGLHRFWDLRSYTGQELALLTGRAHSYSYRHAERFLLRLSAAQADQVLTQALARWTASVWQVGKKSQEASFYVDGHRKPVYTDTLIPRGLIGRLGKIAGCRALALLHDEHGHPLLVTTHRGDLHLTQSLPPLLTSYEQVNAALYLNRLVVDREAMAADFLARAHTEGRTLTTILKTNQYRGLDDFLNVGPFVPLTVDDQGAILREVAPAQFRLARPDRQDEPLLLSVALIRDVRKSVPYQPSEEELPRSWWADIRNEEVAWWQEGWQATAAPAQPGEAKLIPIVSTASQIDALQLDLHPSLACTRECDQRLASASGIRYQPRFCKAAGGEFRGGQKAGSVGKAVCKCPTLW